MADASKAQKLKLANSRKRFKELQELKKKKNATASVDNSEKDLREPTPVDSLVSSTHSSINAESELANVTNTQLPNYFMTTAQSDPATFFENLSTTNTNVGDVGNISDVVETPMFEQHVPFDNNYALFNQTNQQSYIKETQHIIRPNTDSLTIEDPELVQNEIFDHHRHNLIPDQIENSDAQTYEGSYNENNPVHNSFKQNVSDTNLSDFSTQVAHIIPESQSDSNLIIDLEQRNAELTSFLEQEKIQSQQQQLQINELQARIYHLELENATKDNNSVINKLEEDLKCHSQTIRLLVAEKSELSNAVAQQEVTFKNKNSECEELQARLKASRSRAFELEQELNTLKSERIHKETNNHDQNKVLENTLKDFNELRDSKEELEQDILEVREKLKSATQEVLTLQKQNSELSGKLSLADIKIQQLVGADHQTSAAQIESLVQENRALDAEMVSLNNTIKSMSKEHEQSTLHYQQYTEELNTQLLTIQEQYQHIQQENDKLSAEVQNRVHHICDLERQLQNKQNEKVTFTSSNGTGLNVKEELEVTKELCVQLQMEKTELEENYTKALNEKEMLMKELAAKNDSLNQLETMVEQLKGNQPDTAKLLATMESDKVAAARAVQQNMELKEQLESMAEVFAKMNNDKVELTEKLSIQQSASKDLLEKLQKTELHLQMLTDAIEIKDRELSHLREASELNEVLDHEEQHTDESHETCSHTLQNELKEATETIVKLTNELNNQRNQMSPSPQVSVGDDISYLLKQLEELKLKNQELETKLENHTIDDNYNNKLLTEEESESILQKEEAMKRLEEKFKRRMQDIADLTEEKQRLEHLVLQLQGETETIGEYVALYQHQRMILKQKAMEKDQQFKQLATDREQIKIKLEKLNHLVGELLKSKTLSSEILGQCERLHESENKEVETTEDFNKEESPHTETAEEILTLLSEIKSSNLVEPKESIHHCPFCSGQLITV
ncbi:golgin subfamily A member 2 [Diabrotica virgifera virgifera]|uniref:Golgin subfamily A member 2 n=1 Tax=Diabrotica virgifera virgifera TaxID=50390 RepID=A0A6P7GF99_DIAVI|nr:golgin subfamily A member 2 [Diabrotica virgifera virgifera]